MSCICAWCGKVLSTDKDGHGICGECEAKHFPEEDDMTLHERIAECLGWTVKDTQGFSLAMLREMVRDKDPKLASDISRVIQSGSHIFGEPLNFRRRRS